MAAARWSRRSLLRLTALLTGGAAAAPLIQACAPAPAAPTEVPKAAEATKPAAANAAPSPTTAPAPTAAPAATSPPAATKPAAEPTAPPKPAAAPTDTPAAKPAAAAAGGGGTLFYHVSTDMKGGLDATQSVEFHSTKVIAFRISETLLKFDFATNKVVPWLAESFESAPDGKSVMLKLRKGVQFHDGTPFNADAVAFSINRVMDKTHPFNETGTYPYTSWAEPLEKIEKIDDFTVRAVAKAPDPILAWRLTLEPTYIQSPEAIKKHGKEYTNNPSGTGPFKLVEIKKGVSVTLERNPSYWGQKPSLERIVYRLIPDPNAALAELEKGGLHVLSYANPATVEAASKIAEIKLMKVPSIQYSYWGMNNSKPPFDDLKIRQAISHGVDRQARVQLDKGLSEAMPFPWFPGAYGHNPDVRQYPYDPARARALLDEAGWKLGGDGVRAKEGKRMDFEILQWLPPGTQPQPNVLLFQQNMKDIGIATHFRIIEPGQAFDPKIGLYAGDKVELYPLGWNTPMPDPSFLMDETYLCEKRSPKGFNIEQYCTPKVDDLLTQAKTTMDLEKRADLYKQVQRIVADEAVLAWGWRVLFAFLHRPNVQNLAVTSIGDPLLERVTLA